MEHRTFATLQRHDDCQNYYSKRVSAGSLHFIPLCREALREDNAVHGRRSKRVGEHISHVHGLLSGLGATRLGAVRIGYSLPATPGAELANRTNCANPATRFRAPQQAAFDSKGTASLVTLPALLLTGKTLALQPLCLHQQSKG